MRLKLSIIITKHKHLKERRREQHARADIEVEKLAKGGYSHKQDAKRGNNQ